MKKLTKSVALFAGAAIALLAPTAIHAQPADSPASTPAAPAVSPQDPLCRQANRSTPIFESDSTISSALQLVPPNGFVRLVVVPPAGSQFAQINQPIGGYIQTAVLKACSPTPPPPQTACRYLNTNFALNVRRQPRIINNPSNVVGGVNPGERVAVVLNQNGSVSTAQGDGYNWVELDLTKPPFLRPNGGTGWIVNSPIAGPPTSYLGYCR